jgi:hypothetical protein
MCKSKRHSANEIFPTVKSENISVNKRGRKKRKINSSADNISSISMENNFNHNNNGTGIETSIHPINSSPPVLWMNNRPNQLTAPTTNAIDRLMSIPTVNGIGSESNSLPHTVHEAEAMIDTDNTSIREITPLVSTVVPFSHSLVNAVPSFEMHQHSSFHPVHGTLQAIPTTTSVFNNINSPTTSMNSSSTYIPSDTCIDPFTHLPPNIQSSPILNGSVNISEAMEGHGLSGIHTDTPTGSSFLTPSMNRSGIPIELFPSSIHTDTSSESFIKQHGLSRSNNIINKSNNNNLCQSSSMKEHTCPRCNKYWSLITQHNYQLHVSRCGNPANFRRGRTKKSAVVKSEELNHTMAQLNTLTQNAAVINRTNEEISLNNVNITTDPSMISAALVDPHRLVLEDNSSMQSLPTPATIDIATTLNSIINSIEQQQSQSFSHSINDLNSPSIYTVTNSSQSESLYNMQLQSNSSVTLPSLNAIHVNMPMRKKRGRKPRYVQSYNHTQVINPVNDIDKPVSQSPVNQSQSQLHLPFTHPNESFHQSQLSLAFTPSINHFSPGSVTGILKKVWGSVSDTL